MKIQVIKRATGKATFSDPCPYLIEVPPEAVKK
jgi:hypothetical protein